MLVSESNYLKGILTSLDLGVGVKVLNVGSQNEDNLRRQPHVASNITDTIKITGSELINFDLFPGNGVDVFGDIFDEAVFRELKSYKFDIILVFNVLEHVEGVVSFIKRLEGICKRGSLILITVPFKFPYHPDPIDNGFRPSPIEIKSLFTNIVLLKSQVIVDHSEFYYLTYSPSVFFKKIIRILTPFYKYTKWKNSVFQKLFWLNKKYKVSFVMLKKV